MKKLLTLLLLLTLVACSKEPSRTFTPATPTPEAASKDLGAFLRTAPFANEWNPDKDKKDYIVFTNIENVFPHLGKFRNASDTFSTQERQNKADDYYRKETVIYKDPQWGELFVHGMLLYDYQQLYLRPNEAVPGNVIFSGANSIYEHNSSDLRETQLVSTGTKSNSAVYLNTSNHQKYLQYFFQRGQLVGQLNIPFGEHSESEVLTKLKEVVKVLNPEDGAVLNATTDALAINREPVSLWQDPYVEIYPPRSRQSLIQLSIIKMRLKGTPFSKESQQQTTSREADTSYSYQGAQGEVWLAVQTTEAAKDEEEKEKNNQHDKVLTDMVHTTSPSPLYVTFEEQGEQVKGRAVCFKHSYSSSKDYRIVISYGYRAGDTAAQETIEGILTSLK